MNNHFLYRENNSKLNALRGWLFYAPLTLEGVLSTIQANVETLPDSEYREFLVEFHNDLLAIQDISALVKWYEQMEDPQFQEVARILKTRLNS